jgi:hypothetical protein
MRLIKLILKFFIPVILLKRGFLFYNGIKIKTWDRIFFRYYSIRKDDFQINVSKNPFLEIAIPTSHFPLDVQNKLSIWQNENWKDNQFLMKLNIEGFIEPNMGWGLTFDKKIIYHSLGLAGAGHVHKPSLSELYLGRRRTTSLNKVLSLRDTGEENYFHFFNDILSKLFFLKDQGVDLNEFHVLVSKKLYDREYFQAYLKNTWLQNLNWYVQGDEWIKFDKAIFCKPFTHTKRYFLESVNLIKPSETKKKNRKVFLIRDSRSLRYIENIDHIKPILEKYNFEIFDAARLPFLTQVELFSETGFLIGVHGAGLTNMIFREGQPLRVLEIAHPFKYIPFHYIMLAKQFDYQYNIILGTKGLQHTKGGFIVNPDLLEKSIKELM